MSLDEERRPDRAVRSGARSGNQTLKTIARQGSGSKGNRWCTNDAEAHSVRSGYDMACAILKASPAALRARLREADADPWTSLAEMRNHASQLRLQAASLSARGQRLDAYPLETEAAITEAAINKLEGLMVEGVPDAVAA